MCYAAPFRKHTRQLNQTKPALSGHHVKDSLSRLHRTHLTQESISTVLTGSNEVLFSTKKYFHKTLTHIDVNDS